MKRYLVPCFVLLFFVGSTLSTQARTEGLISSEGDDVRLSLDYSHSQAKFEPSNGTPEGDTTLKQNYAGVRLETALSENLQLYVSGGQVMNEYGDTDVEDGTRFGGGVQYVFDENDNLRYKLIGSFMRHSEEDFETSSNASLEVVDDWQAGIEVSRRLTAENQLGSIDRGYAFMNLLYSGREVELTENNTTTDLEYSQVGGVHVTGGVHINVEDNLAVELEAQAGSTFAGTARVSTQF